MDGAFIETDCSRRAIRKTIRILKSYVMYHMMQKDLQSVYAKGNEALLKAVNEAIADAIEDGSMEKYHRRCNMNLQQVRNMKEHWTRTVQFRKLMQQMTLNNI